MTSTHNHTTVMSDIKLKKTLIQNRPGYFPHTKTFKHMKNIYFIFIYIYFSSLELKKCMSLKPVFVLRGELCVSADPRGKKNSVVIM